MSSPLNTPVDSQVAAALATLPLARLTHFTPAMNLPSVLGDRELRSVGDLRADVRSIERVPRGPDLLLVVVRADLLARRLRVHLPGPIALERGHREE